MILLLDILIILACMAGLWVGANWLVDSSVTVAKKIGISELAIGLTVVSIGTSAPEFAVTILSAIKGHANISVANVVGSNIFNLGFILGGVALIRPVITSGIIVKRDGSVLILSTFLLLFIFRDLNLSLAEGILLLSLLFCYILSLFYFRETDSDETASGTFNWYQPVKLFTGLTAILLSSHFMVDSAVTIARFFNVSDWVIGVTIVALGTSIPELSTSLVAVLRGHYGLSAGNLIGSDIFNLLGVLGFAGAMTSITVSPAAYSSLLLLCGMVIIVVIMMRTGWKISRLEGGILLCIGILRWVVDFSG